MSSAWAGNGRDEEKNPLAGRKHKNIVMQRQKAIIVSESGGGEGEGAKLERMKE